MEKLKGASLIILDMVFVNLCYIVGIFLVSLTILDDVQIYFTMKCFFVTIIYGLTFFIFKLYNSLWKYATIDEFLFVICANLVSGFTFFGIDYYVNGVTRMRWIGTSMVLTTCATVGFRAFFRIYRVGLIYVSKNSKKNCERVMIVGAGSAGTMILKEMLTSEYMNLNPVVLIDDEHEKLGKIIYGVKVQGKTKDIKRIAKDMEINTIIIAIPSIENNVRAELIRICKETGCKVKTMPGLYEIINGTVGITNIRDVELEDLLGRESINLDMNEISRYISNKVVMVTGGGGSIGSELCRQIVKFNPSELILVDIYENNAYDIQNELLRMCAAPNLKVLIASVRDKKRMEDIFREHKPNIVFHAAAHKHVPLMEDSPGEAIKNNVFGTLNMVELADTYGIEKFVLISTDKAVNPTNVMGATKRLCEMIVQAKSKESKTEFAAVRFGNVLGSNGSVIPLFKKQISEGGPVTVTHPEITRYFMLIPEAAQLVIQASAYAKGGEIFVLDMGRPVKIYDLACDLIKLSGFEPYKDINIEITGLRPGEKLYEELLMDEEGLRETAHKKIFIGKPNYENFDDIKTKIDKINQVIEEGNNGDIIKELGNIVKTFKHDDSNINGEFIKGKEVC